VGAEEVIVHVGDEVHDGVADAEEFEGRLGHAKHHETHEIHEKGKEFQPRISRMDTD
jgi:hypothetical protein